MTFIQESWKAIVALLIPIAYGAAIEMIDALNQWAAGEGSPWAILIGAMFTSVGVWLKANKPSA